MAMFVKVDERWGLVALLAAGIAAFAVLAPEQFGDIIDAGSAAINTFIEGVSG